MRILVTGATGLVGSALVRQLVAQDATVRILRRPNSPLDALGEAADAVEHAVGDLTEGYTVRQAMHGITHVYHAAARVDLGGDLRTLRPVNVQGTAHVLNAARQEGVARVVHTSSIAALGRPASHEGLISEDTAWTGGPTRSAYAQTKRESELQVHRSIAEGLDAVIVNPALVFGTGRPDASTHQIVQAVRSERLPGVPPGGTCVVDAEDVAMGMRRAMLHGTTGRRYILGSQNLSWAQIIGTLAEAHGVEAPERVISEGWLRVAGGLAEAWAWLTRATPRFSRTMAHTASRTMRYDTTRARTELECTFRPFSDTAARIAEEESATAVSQIIL